MPDTASGDPKLFNLRIFQRSGMFSWICRDYSESWPQPDMEGRIGLFLRITPLLPAAYLVLKPAPRRISAHDVGTHSPPRPGQRHQTPATCGR